MKRIGIIYSTVDGQTKKICERLVNLLEDNNIQVELFSIDNFQQHVSDYDTLIIGASIRYGKHNSLIKKFIIDNKKELRNINSAFFSVNLVARKEDKNKADTNPYLVKFIKSINWTPDILDVFAGTLDYKSYSFIDKMMIKLIMKMTGGPTKTNDAIEYTDWNRVRIFGDRICKIEQSNKHN